MLGQVFKFNGSTFAVQTGFAATKTITDIDSTDPALVTSTAHGLIDGAVGKIAAVVGMIEVNGGLYVVDNSATNAFELAGVDATGYSAYVSGGTFAPATFSNFCELTGVNQQDGTADRTEVTSICSNAKEFVTGLSDSGTLSLDFNWAGNQPVQAALRAAKKAGTVLSYEVGFPEDGGKAIMFGTVSATSFQGAVNGVWKGSATIQLTGEIFVLPAA